MGESLPLGVGAAGVVILAIISDEEGSHAMQFNAIGIAQFRRVRPLEILQDVSEAQHRGYTIYSGQIVTGMGATELAV